MAVVRIEHVTKRYGAAEVLADFSLAVADGEFIVLVGPSGCGKSTLLKILAGLEPATAGRIFIGDREVTDLSPGDRDIAMVFQNYALYPHLTVRRNMAFGLRMRRMQADEIAARVEAAAKMLGIEQLLDRKPRALSGGQRQRVALGRAIVREPQAFLMDEPLSNLDAKLRVRMRGEISALHKRLGVTTVFVTHDQIEAMTMADRIVIMRAGMIQQIATPDEMFARPVNVFVAAFIGSPGMNFLQARVSVDRGVTTARVFGQDIRLSVAPAWRERLGEPFVILGVRPEHLSAGPGAISFEVIPRRIESLGSECYVYFDIPAENVADIRDIPGGDDIDHGATMIARLFNTAKVLQGDAIRLSFDPSDIYAFDPQTHESLGWV
jgi:multiple sugar transport system ATP-binding protein